MAAVGDEVCYLCGVAGDTLTKEHVVPRTLYENRKIPNDAGALILSAHRECNQSTSWDETWMSVVSAVTQPPALRNRERWERALRTLERPDEPDKGTGFRKAFFESMIDSPAGESAIRLEPIRLGYFLAKIAKGVAYDECRLLLLDPYLWMWCTLTPEEFTKTPHLPSRNVHDIVFAKWMLADNAHSFMCWIAMRDASCYLVAARTPQAWGNRKGPCRLPWPRVRWSPGPSDGARLEGSSDQ
jgi:hypothetical protein